MFMPIIIDSKGEKELTYDTYCKIFKTTRRLKLENSGYLEIYKIKLCK